MFQCSKLLYLFLQLNIVKAQFPNHLDLQKVGEVEYNDEKYRLLKPTRHQVRDHFYDFIRKNNAKTTDFPRQLIDLNGFRHYWSNFDETKLKSRKADLDFLHSIGGKADQENVVMKAVLPEEASPSSTTSTTKKRRTKPVKETKADIVKAIKQRWDEESKQALRNAKGNGKEMYLVAVTYFCPFFGVIQTHHYVDKPPKSAG